MKWWIGNSDKDPLEVGTQCDADCDIPDCDGSAHQPSWKKEEWTPEGRPPPYERGNHQ